MRRLLVDGTNVRRSTWPNVGEQALVDALDEQAEPGQELLVTFDAPPGVAAGTARVEVRCVPYADDLLVDLARDWIAAGDEVRVVTSDRELRARLEAAGAAIACGGGALLAQLGLARPRRSGR